MNGYGTESMTYGVPTTTWNSWSAHTRELWLQDYNRTEEQATYYKDSPEAYAFKYVSTVDDIMDTTKDYATDIYTGATDFGEKALLYGGIGLALILLLK